MDHDTTQAPSAENTPAEVATTAAHDTTAVPPDIVATAAPEAASAAVPERAPATPAAVTWTPARLAGVAAATFAGAAIVVTLLVPKPSTETRAGAAPALSPVRAAPSARASSAVVEPSARPGWRIASEWVGTRKRSLAYELEADNKVHVWMRQVRPVLVVRCLSREIDAFVVTGSASSAEAGRDDHAVHVTMDDQPPAAERWLDSAEHDALFAPRGATFVDRLAKARSLRFEFTPHNTPTAEASFDLTGAADVAARLARTCR